jgi:hypothetical protein
MSQHLRAVDGMGLLRIFLMQHRTKNKQKQM